MLFVLKFFVQDKSKKPKNLDISVFYIYFKVM